MNSMSSLTILYWLLGVYRLAFALATLALGSQLRLTTLLATAFARPLLAVRFASLHEGLLLLPPHLLLLLLM